MQHGKAMPLSCSSMGQGHGFVSREHVFEFQIQPKKKATDIPLQGVAFGTDSPETIWKRKGKEKVKQI